MSVQSASKPTHIRSNFSKILLAGILVGGLSTGAIVAAENAADTASDPVSQQVHAAFDHCQNAIVKIEAVDEHLGRLSGTGFFIDPNGTIYTSYSIGGESHDIIVSHGNKKYPATRLVGDPRSGIAMLKIETSTPFLLMGKTGDLRVATPVLAIGYPMDLPLTPSLGVIAGMDSKNSEGYFLTKHIRANVTVERGQGGSPLLNLKGEVVGIVISNLDYGIGCYALPIDAAEKIHRDYVRFGTARPGWIGVNVVQLPNERGDSTVVVNDLLKNTPAAKCGLKKGDILLQVGDKKITALDDVPSASFYLTAGDEVPVTVQRGGEKITLNAQAIDPNVPNGVAAYPPESSGIPLRMER